MSNIPSQEAIRRTVEATGLEPMQAYHHLASINAVQAALSRQSERRTRARIDNQWAVQ